MAINIKTSMIVVVATTVLHNIVCYFDNILPCVATEYKHLIQLTIFFANLFIYIYMNFSIGRIRPNKEEKKSYDSLLFVITSFRIMIEISLLILNIFFR